MVAGGQTYSLQLDPGQNFAGKSFRLSSDGAGGTDIQVVNGATINIVAGYGVVQSGAFSITIGTSLGRSQQTYVDSSFSYTSVRQELINEGAAGASTLPVTNPSTRVLGLGPA